MAMLEDTWILTFQCWCSVFQCLGCGHKKTLGWTDSPSVNKKCTALWPGLCWASSITCSKPLFQMKRTYKTSNTVFPSSCKSSSIHQICYESWTHGCEMVHTIFGALTSLVRWKVEAQHCKLFTYYPDVSADTQVNLELRHTQDCT